MKEKDFVSLKDWSADELNEVLDQARAIRRILQSTADGSKEWRWR